MGKKKKKQTKKSVRPGKDYVDSKAERLHKKRNKIIAQGIMELKVVCVQEKSVDPVGLSVIAATHNTMKNDGAKLLIKNVPDEINTIFDALGLNKHLEIEQINQNA